MSPRTWTFWRIFREVRTWIVLLLLFGLLLSAAFWGALQLIRDPERSPEAACITVAESELLASQTTANVYNGGTVAGLATRVMQNLKSKGFNIQTASNTSERVQETIIRGTRADAPQVRLIAAFFPGATVVADGRTNTTVDVLVGDKFAPMDLKAPTSISVPATTVCPTPSSSPTATPGTATPTSASSSN